jgi:hypothetical protein
MITSMPSSRARSATPARAAAPPPDLGFTNRTGERTGPAGRQPSGDSGGRGRLMAWSGKAMSTHGTGRAC